ncbi:MAG: N-acetylmuramic acid 6-phosphate etherase [Bacillati bacterium ANGP1]|uniref:N-acetylmuramic acid 6-phosphate etherase n=1 Tax=Candidatus Segetimicrobium genomatis TaxID=2569760 RepID=A0A537L549_9BACT|nr:MAG: N-acetylmuramic acid 6-phosphate etherase [Terrabacteria group bacterium ANGP1]
MNDEKTLPVTEMRNPRSMDLDVLSSEQMLQVINAEDRTVADAVAAQIPQIAKAVEAAAGALRGGGRLIYVGAGSSGRIGLLDALECPPTFGVAPELVQAIVAGGGAAEAGSAAELEDDPALGADLIAQRSVGSRDIVVGLAASGTTPFTLGALREAHRCGAMTVAITCVPGSPLAQAAGIAITPLVGPEVLTGSTRMKAGTAQKLVCNMLTTATMVRLGKVYSNLMVEVQPRNAKLAVRAVWMIAQAVDCSPEDARAWLGRAGGDVKTAIVMARTGVSRERAQALLVQADGAVRVALQHASGGPEMRS